MRICLITRYFTFRNAGIGRVSSEIANRLEARGHDVYRISTDTWSLYQYFRYTAFELAHKIPKGYDIYHALTPLEATYIPKNKGVVTFYDFIPVLHPEKAGTGLHSSWILNHGSRKYFKIASQIATRCAGLTAISEETKGELQTYFGVKKNITVVRLGIRSDLNPEPKFDDVFRIGYLGQLDRRKRVNLLVEAFHNSKVDGELVIGGTGPEEIRLKAIADNDSRIKFLGEVPDDKLPDFYNSLDLFVFPSWCLPPSTKIICQDRVKEIKEIQANDMVLTHKGQFCKVIRTFQRQYKGELVNIKPYKLGRTLQLTPEHPVLVINKTWRMSKPHKWNQYPPDFTTYWIKASELTNQHMLCIPKIRDNSFEIDSSKYVEGLVKSNEQLYSSGKNQFGSKFQHPNCHPIPRILDTTDNFLELAGYYLAEGCSGDDGLCLCFSSFEQDKIERSTELMTKYGMKCRVNYQTRHRSNQFGTGRLWGKLFGSLLGNNSHNKRIPPFLLQLNNKQLIKLWIAMEEGDGYSFSIPTATRTPSTRYDYTTVSEELALVTFLMLTKLGFRPSLYQASRESKEYIVSFTTGKNCMAKQNDEYMFLPIKKVWRSDYNGYVHNIQIENDDSYVAEGICVHNCEGYGLPTVEAMACKKPVFVLSDSIIPKVVREKCFKVDNLESLFSSINFWMQLGEGRLESNYKFAKSHDWNRCVDVYEAIYQNIKESK